MVSYQYLDQLYPQADIESLNDDHFLHFVLNGETNKSNRWKDRINGLLELAGRYKIMEEIRGRLLSDDQDTWDSAINELQIAKYFEECFGQGCLTWRPGLTNGKIGEFRVSLAESCGFYVEVKTIVNHEQERLEAIIDKKVRRIVESINKSAVLVVRLEKLGENANFRESSLRSFLIQKLEAVDKLDIGYDLGSYEDVKTGTKFDFSILPLPHNPINTCHVGIMTYLAHFGDKSSSVLHSLEKAYSQRPSEGNAFMVVICPSNSYGIDTDDVLAAVLGTEEWVVDLSDNNIPPKGNRRPNGFFNPNKNRQISCVGLWCDEYYPEKWAGRLELFHNPFSHVTIAPTIFTNKCVRQLIRKKVLLVSCCFAA